MAIAVQLPDALVKEVRSSAAAQMRSVPKQIEYYYRLGKAAEDNPDLPVSFIKGVLEAIQEEPEPFDLFERKDG